MEYKITKLSSGLRFLYVPVRGSESSTITVWVKTGSRNEEEKIGGISHFLEHMVFKGSKKRPTAKEISEVVDGIGGEFNAGTSKDWTNFYIKARNGAVDTAFDILSDMVLRPILQEEEIEREKGTIIQEIATYEDTPMMKIGDVFENLVYGEHPLGRDIAGTPETVKAVKKNDFLRYRESYYYPENMLITVTGGVTQNSISKLVEKYFGKFQITNSKLQINFKFDKFQNGQKNPQIKIKYKKSDQAHFILGFTAEGRGYKGRFAQSVLAAILGAGMSSRLFIEVRERRGLAYSVRTSMDRYQEVGYMGTYVGTDPKKADEAVKIVLDQHFGIPDSRFQIQDSELRKAKEYIKGHLALALEDTHDVGSYFGEQAMFLPRILTPEEVYKKIDEVTTKDILHEAKKLFVPERLNLAIIGPFKDDKKFVELLKWKEL